MGEWYLIKWLKNNSCFSKINMTLQIIKNIKYLIRSSHQESGNSKISIDLLWNVFNYLKLNKLGDVIVNLKFLWESFKQQCTINLICFWTFKVKCKELQLKDYNTTTQTHSKKSTGQLNSALTVRPSIVASCYND